MPQDLTITRQADYLKKIIVPENMFHLQIFGRNYSKSNHPFLSLLQKRQQK